MKTETRTIFIAEDGTEFDSEAEAAAHEHFHRIVRLLDSDLTYSDACDAARRLLDAGTYQFHKPSL